MIITQQIQAFLAGYSIELDDEHLMLIDKRLIWLDNPTFNPDKSVAYFKESSSWENCLENLILLGFSSTKTTDFEPELEEEAESFVEIFRGGQSL